MVQRKWKIYVIKEGGQQDPQLWMFRTLKSEDFLPTPSACPNCRYQTEICIGKGMMQLVTLRKESSL